ncbi:MAG: Flp pilus assembly protein CpaB [Gammaproteobacteria bacterium]|jgi:Flp pilus assembly protein CpaB|nr:Flp pilus assembly protein CpaB [Gammaproteobacteria bacterium]
MAKKQENSAIPLIAGALGFGVIAALLAMFYLNAKEAELKAKYEQDQARTLRVVVANQDLPKGTEITENLFSALQVPDDYVHDDAIFPSEFDRYIGRSLVANLGIGKTLLKSFIDDDFPRDFSDVVPPGKRAMTISVDDINSIGGFLRPGNRVDVFVNIPFAASGFSAELFAAAQEAGVLAMLPTEILTSIPGELLEAAEGVENPTELLGMLAPDDVIIPVSQNVTVLAAGRDPYSETLDALRQPQRRSETTFSHITLEVDPQQAALITIAIDKGDIVTLLRNRNDQGASAFTTVGSPDLFSNAVQMAQAEKERASRATVAAGVDVNGNLVDADGNKVLSAEQLAAAGYSVNENGQIVDKDGNVVNPEDIVIAADGTVMTKQQLAAAGLTINDKGQIIDKDGNVVDVNDVVVAADGTVMTKQQLAASGLSVNANGEIVDANGKVLSANEMVVAKDGTVITKDQLAAAGYSINENGEIVDKDGNVVNPDDLIIAADGSVLSKEQLAAAGLSVNELGQIVDKDGNIVDPKSIVVASDGSVMTKEQLAAAGLSIDENGNIVDSNGNIVDKNDLVTSANGEILSKKQLEKAGIKVAAGVDQNGNLVDANGKAIASRAQLEAAGYTVNEKGEIIDKNGNVVDPSKIMIGADGKILSDKEISQVADSQTITGTKRGGRFTLIIGGGSENGQAKSFNLNISPDEPVPAEE